MKRALKKVLRLPVGGAPTEVSPEEVTRIIRKWRERLFLMLPWTIEVIIHKKPKDQKNKELRKEAYACISAEPEYFQATIELHAWKLQQIDLESVILHELVHIITAPAEVVIDSTLGKKFERVAEQIQERVVDHIALALLHMDREEGT